MKRMILLAATTVLGAAPLQAHNAWIKPSTTNVAGADGWVTLDAAASTDVFNADHQPLQLEQIKARAPDGSEAQIENGTRGRFRSTFDVHLNREGTWRIGMQNDGVSGSYKLDGQEYRVGGRRPGPGGPGAPGAPARPTAANAPASQNAQGPATAPAVNFMAGGADFVPPAGATDVKLTLSGNRNEVFVTLGKPSEVKLTGKGLEMQPITHPADLTADAPGKFRFLVDGKPAAGLEVEVVPDGRRFRDSQGTISVKTDAKGEASVAWPAAGLYWMHAAFSDETSPRPGIGGRRFQYSASLEVMAP